MLFARIVLTNFLIIVVNSQVTHVIKQNPLLSRKKRFLMFPKNSNFVISMSYVKALLMVQPRGWNALGECDFPFPLPSDTRLFKKKRRNHHIQRREVLEGLEVAFTRGGFNGTACVKRMVCEARIYVDSNDKSLVKDILLAILATLESDELVKQENGCDSTFTECEVSFLGYVLASLFNV